MSREGMSRHQRFAMGYRTMCMMWSVTGTGASVESEYEMAKNKLTDPDGDHAYGLGSMLALYHLNGVDL